MVGAGDEVDLLMVSCLRVMPCDVIEASVVWCDGVRCGGRRVFA